MTHCSAARSQSTPTLRDLAEMARAGGAGAVAKGTAKGAKFFKEHAAAGKLLKVLSAFNALHTAAVQYRESAAETEAGRVTTALSVAIASGVLGVVTAASPRS